MINHQLTIKNQNGAALMVSLILLLVLTIIAIVGMSTATLELAMAGNMQYQNSAFEAAESIVEAELQRNDLIPLAVPGLLNPVSPMRNYSNPDGRVLSSATATTNYFGLTGVSGWQLGGGTSFAAFHFEINGVATAAQGATASHRQGIYVVGPSL